MPEKRIINEVAEVLAHRQVSHPSSDLIVPVVLPRSLQRRFHRLPLRDRVRPGQPELAPTWSVWLMRLRRTSRSQYIVFGLETMACTGPGAMVGIPANVATEDVRIVVERAAGTPRTNFVLGGGWAALRVLVAGCVEVMSSA